MSKKRLPAQDLSVNQIEIAMTPEDLNPTFCRNLRAIRIAQHLTQKQLADAIGTAPSVIIGWEQGKKSPTLTTVAKLSTALNVEPLTLLGESTSNFLSTIPQVLNSFHN